MTNILSVQHLIKRYKKASINAVDDISFEIQAGQFFALLGPNGAGKTTTISILTTTLTKTSGTVNIAGFDLDKNPSQIRQNVGIIFQNPSLDQNLSAEENIRFHVFLYGLYPFVPTYSLMPKAYKDRVHALAEVLGIQKQIFDKIKTFSGGMKRKLEIIRSLIHNPKVLFLDEPTSGLDPLSRRNLWEYLEDVRRKQKITIFLTTHYLEEAEDAEQVCIINNGKIVVEGTPAHIKSKLIETFLIVGAKNQTKLIAELNKLKLTYSPTPDHSLKIPITNHSAQQIISSIKTPLTTLQTHNPTLEEAYLEIIGASQES